MTTTTWSHSKANVRFFELYDSIFNNDQTWFVTLNRQRDSIMYKRIRLPGHMMNDMFREFYEDFLTSIKEKTDVMIEHDKKKSITAEIILKDILDNSHSIFNNSVLKKHSQIVYG